ncbi:MAG: chorismate mutase [Aeromonas sp.]
MATLDELRQDITQLDQALLALLAKRKGLSIEVARAKQANPRPIRDPQREQALLVALIQQGRELGLDAHYITRLYHTIIEDSVRSQQAYLQSELNPALQTPNITIAYLGPRGTDTSRAAHAYLAHHNAQVIDVHCEHLREVLDTVESGRATLGLLPIEHGIKHPTECSIEHAINHLHGYFNNHFDGHINESADESADEHAPEHIYEQIRRTNLAIVGELTYPIMPPLVSTECHDIASPIHNAANNTANNAANGLHVGATAKSDQYARSRRFIVVASQPILVAPQIPAKTTLIITTDPQAHGPLMQQHELTPVRQLLRRHAINITALTPLTPVGNPAEARFGLDVARFGLDVAANLQSPVMQGAVIELTKITRAIKVLGCYPSEEIIPTPVPPELMEG